MNLKSFATTLLTMLALLALWAGITYKGNIPELFFPKPQHVFRALLNLLSTPEFGQDVFASFYRVFTAFVLSIAVSYPLVMLTLINKHLKKVIFIPIEFFRYLPITVFVPLTILWFGIDDSGKIIIVFLGTFAQMVPMFYDSTVLLKNQYESFPAALKWSRVKVVSKVIIPGSAPYIFDNARICFGWAWTYLIIAELLGAEHGLGYAIIRSQRYLATDKIFAYVIVIGLIGLISDRLMVFTHKKLFNW
ncbi:MAG: ABC transporter permease [Bacteroidota bacterium]